MYRLLLLSCLALSVVACQPQPLIPPTVGNTAASTNALPEREATVQVVDATLQGYAIRVETKEDWNALVLEDSIVLTENQHSINDTQDVDGLLINIFVPDVVGYRNISSTDNNPLALLRYIVETPSYIGDAAVVPPRAFEWGGRDAAYYTLYNGQGRYTLVMAVDSASEDGVIVLNVSAPEAQIADVRGKLNDGLQALHIGNVSFSNSELTLPDPIPFPSDDVEIATENTPEPR